MTLRLVLTVWIALAAPSALAQSPDAAALRRDLADRAAGPLVGATELFHKDDATGLVLSGFDPVTYFLPEGPQAGAARHELIWNGVAWRFASAANRAAFEANPNVYAPRLGGYDAEAMARGRIVDADPMLYAVRDRRLYVFRSDANRARFMADPAIAQRAEDRWSELKGTLVQP